jgi:hypothetical protein
MDADIFRLFCPATVFSFAFKLFYSRLIDKINSISGHDISKEKNT